MSHRLDDCRDTPTLYEEVQGCGGTVRFSSPINQENVVVKITIIIGLATFLFCGCTTIRFKYDLAKFQDRAYDKTQSDFKTIVGFLIQDHSAARDYLQTNMPEVVSVHRKYWARGFCVLTYRYRNGVCEGHVFCSDGSDFAAAPVEYADDPIIKDAVRRQLKFVSRRKAEALKKKFELEELAISDSRKICFADLVGVKVMTPIAEYLRNAGIWPDHSDNDIDMYLFDFRHEYKEGTIPGLVPIDDFAISGLTVDRKTGGLLDVFMRRHVGINEIDRFITSTIHTLKAKLHTEKQPKRSSILGNQEYSWPYMETSDGRKLTVRLSYSMSTVFNRYDVLLSISDGARAEKYFGGLFETKTRKSKEAKYKRDEGLIHDKDTKVYGLYNRISRYLAIIQTEKSTGSGFLVSENNRCYLYTNEHIVRKAKSMPTAMTLDGNSLKLGSFELAKGRDLVRFEVDGFDKGLTIASGLPEINKDIVVFGNSDGVGVATTICGKIVGVGPKLIEVSAEFVQGNSGSPVLLFDGSVVGIATFAIDTSEFDNWLKKDTRFNGVRRFALRMNDIEWQGMKWELYSTIVNRW